MPTSDIEEEDDNDEADTESGETTVIHLTSDRSSPVVEDTYDNRMIGGLDDTVGQEASLIKPDQGDNDVHPIPNANSYIEPYSWLMDPKIFVSDGYLFFRNPSNALPGSYMTVITVTVTLSTRRSKGWHELIITGLPRSRGGDSGFFLFQVPEDVGMVLHATNLCRYEIVEDCFCAEFIGDLVIPFHRCSSKYYGTVRSFTVDYDVRADMAPPSRDNSPGISLKYHAVCSLQMYNFCYMTQRCSFPINIEGGPAGSFKCKLKPQQERLPIIHLDADKEDRIGLSQIEIICPPKDLKIFIVTWTINLPKRTSIWLPRIYRALSEPYGRESDYLRRHLSECHIADGSSPRLVKDGSEASSEFAIYPEVDVVPGSNLEMRFRQEHLDINKEPSPRSDICYPLPLRSKKELTTVRKGVIINIFVLTLIALFLGFSVDQSADIQSRFAVPFWTQTRRDTDTHLCCRASREFNVINTTCLVARNSFRGFSAGMEPTARLNSDQAQMPSENGSQLKSGAEHDIKNPHHLPNIVDLSNEKLRDVINSTTLPNTGENYIPNPGFYGDMSKHEGSKVRQSRNRSQGLVTKSFRDNLDYFLGWRGPFSD